MIRDLLRALGALSMCAAFAACSPDPTREASAPEGPLSILLITLDTTRADRLGAYGYEDAHTPNLDRLAREGVLFEQAVAPTPLTLPSHASLLTGVTPQQHGVLDNGVFRLGSDARILPEILLRRGWRTAAFVGSFILAPQFGLGQGFEVYGAPQGGDSLIGDSRTASAVTRDAIRWLSGLGKDEAFFLWVHFYDPHARWEPPPPWRTRLHHPYDGEIAFCDEQVGRLLEALAERGLDRNLLTVVTADHGESLGEHDEATHGVFLYQSTLHVPLIFHGPAVAGSSGTRVGRRVSITALPGTLLALAGVPRDKLPEAASASIFENGKPLQAPAEPIHVESLMPFHTLGWRGLAGLVTQDYKLIEGSEPELYALDEDPREERNLAASQPERVDTLRSELHALAARPSLGWASRRGASAEEAEQLAALGYVTGTTGGDPFAADLPDPRERMGDLERYREAVKLLLRGLRLLPDDPRRLAAVPEAKRQRGFEALRRARSILSPLHDTEPASPFLAYRLGLAESKLEQHAAALPLLELARLNDESDARLHYRLGLAYEAAGRRGDARRAVRSALSIEAADFYRRWLEDHPAAS